MIVLSSKIEINLTHADVEWLTEILKCCDHLQSENQLILFGCGCILNAFGFWFFGFFFVLILWN